MLLMPALARLLGLPPEVGGAWIGSLEGALTGAVAALMLITYVPALSLWLPWLLR